MDAHYSAVLTNDATNGIYTHCCEEDLYLRQVIYILYIKKQTCLKGSSLVLGQSWLRTSTRTTEAYKTALIWYEVTSCCWSL